MTGSRFTPRARLGVLSLGLLLAASCAPSAGLEPSPDDVPPVLLSGPRSTPETMGTADFIRLQDSARRLSARLKGFSDTSAAGSGDFGAARCCAAQVGALLEDARRLGSSDADVDDVWLEAALRRLVAEPRTRVATALADTIVGWVGSHTPRLRTVSPD